MLPRGGGRARRRGLGGPCHPPPRRGPGPGGMRRQRGPGRARGGHRLRRVRRGRTALPGRPGPYRARLRHGAVRSQHPGVRGPPERRRAVDLAAPRALGRGACERGVHQRRPAQPLLPHGRGPLPGLPVRRGSGQPGGRGLHRLLPGRGGRPRHTGHRRGHRVREPARGDGRAPRPGPGTREDGGCAAARQVPEGGTRGHLPFGQHGHFRGGVGRAVPAEGRHPGGQHGPAAGGRGPGRGGPGRAPLRRLRRRGHGHHLGRGLQLPGRRLRAQRSPPAGAVGGHLRGVAELLRQGALQRQPPGHRGPARGGPGQVPCVPGDVPEGRELRRGLLPPEPAPESQRPAPGAVPAVRGGGPAQPQAGGVPVPGQRVAGPVLVPVLPRAGRAFPGGVREVASRGEGGPGAVAAESRGRPGRNRVVRCNHGARTRGDRGVAAAHGRRRPVPRRGATAPRRLRDPGCARAPGP